MSFIATFKKNPWSWIPTLYYIQGLPNVMVVEVSVAMYATLSISNSDIGFYTSLFYLPWVIKPFWSPLVDTYKTKRWWTVATQFTMSLLFAGIILALISGSFFLASVILFYFIALLSATHDIAADGFYMLALSEEKQSFFVGIRSTFFRIAIISGKGGLIVLAGYMIESGIDTLNAWSISFGIVAVLFFLLSFYHSIVLPKPDTDFSTQYDNVKDQLSEFLKTIVTFFKKDDIWVSLLFILFYRFGEAQLVKMSSPFFLAPIEEGGLGLSLQALGTISGTIGVLALVFGGILGGILISRNGLKFWLWPMIIAMNVPNLSYVILSFTQSDSYFLISSLVALEQFGYGFGFAAFLMFLIYIAKGEYKTSHYAFATGFMALGLMLPGIVSGYIQEWLGYKEFFIWIMIATIPIFLIAPFIKIEDDFGKKKQKPTT